MLSGHAARGLHGLPRWATSRALLCVGAGARSEEQNPFSPPPGGRLWLLGYTSVLTPSTPPLLLQGTLQRTSLPEILIRTLDERVEGTLVLQPPGGDKHAVLFLAGAPAKSKLTRDVVPFGSVVLKLGLIDAAALGPLEEQARAAAEPLEAFLFEAGHLSKTQLHSALREQLAEQILWLAHLPGETAFGLYQANYLASVGPLKHWRVKPLPLLWRALVTGLPEQERDVLLDAVAGQELRMRLEAPVSRYHLTAEEQRIVDVLKIKAHTLADVEDAGVGQRDLVRKVVAALVLSRQLELNREQGLPVGTNEPNENSDSISPPSERTVRASGGAPRVRFPSHDDLSSKGHDVAPASAAASTKTAARAGSPSQVQTQKDAILAWDKNPPETLYEVLGVPEDADAAAIRAAFFQLAKQWHPDRLPEGLAELRPIVTRAFARMGEAHQLLIDPRARAEYDKKLSQVPDSEQAQVAEIINAATAFQRAEILVRKKDLAGALVDAEKAYRGDSTQTDYAGLYGWLLGTVKGEAEQGISIVSSAIERDQENVKALWYRALLYKKIGKEQQALRDCKKILQIKPQHTDAAREVRVYEMRKRSGPHPQPGGGGGGLLARFRKKG